jgi:glycerol uptake facilitator-like aquaporin
MKKYIAEIIGTATLTGVVSLSIMGVFPIPTPLLAALVLGLFVYSIGHISGTHINPAVTIGAWSIGKVPAREALLYIVSQVIGAGIAFVLVSVLVMTPHVGMVGNTLNIALAECIGTFLFTFGIASVIYGRTPSQLSGVVVGGSLLLGIAVAALLGSNGVLNPAVALGIGSFNLVYLMGPILGSILGMQTYKHISETGVSK